MSNIGINLIPGEERSTFEVIALHKKIKFVAILLTICSVLALFLCFSLFFITRSQLEETSVKISSTEGRIKSFKEKETDLVILENRVGFISKILSDRQRVIETLTELKQLSPLGVSFEIIESTGEKKVKIVVGTSDLVALNEFVNKITHSNFTDNFSLFEISSITRTNKGTYNFVIECTRKNDGKV